MHRGHPQFVVSNAKYVKRKGIETKDEHLTRSFAATQKGGICRMGTMDIEWCIGELDKFVGNVSSFSLTTVTQPSHNCYSIVTHMLHKDSIRNGGGEYISCDGISSVTRSVAFCL